VAVDVNVAVAVAVGEDTADVAVAVGQPSVGQGVGVSVGVSVGVGVNVSVGGGPQLIDSVSVVPSPSAYVPSSAVSVTEWCSVIVPPPGAQVNPSVARRPVYVVPANPTPDPQP
jgi:hypothetical protein